MAKTINKCKICMLHPIQRSRVEWARKYNKESYNSIANRLGLSIREVRSHFERHSSEFLMLPTKDFESVWKDDAGLRKSLAARRDEPQQEHHFVEFVIILPKRMDIKDLEKYISQQ